MERVNNDTTQNSIKDDENNDLNNDNVNSSENCGDIKNVASPKNEINDKDQFKEANKTNTNIENGGDKSTRSNNGVAKEADRDVLEIALEQLGNFGLYHKYVVFMLCIPNIFAAMYSLNYVFVADQVPYRCVIPECEGDAGLTYVNETIQALLPDNSCRRYVPLEDNTCDREGYHANDTMQCEQYIYMNHDTIFVEGASYTQLHHFRFSSLDVDLTDIYFAFMIPAFDFVHIFELACREFLRTLVGTLRNTALPLSLILTGYISDTWGRKTAFCLFSACAGVMGIIKGFSVNYQMFVSFEFLEAALGYGFNSAAYVMMVEFARPSLRATFACATGMAYGLGGVLFALVAWQVPYWRHLVWTIYTPALLLPLYWLLIDESPRWLFATGKVEQTVQVIRKAAMWNKVMLKDELLKDLEKEQVKEESKPKTNVWLQLLKSRVLMTRFAICSWCWISSTFVYYGLTINSVNLSGDKYVNFALNMAMEIVASLLLMMMLERFGRKKSIFVAFVLCGIACVTPYFISHTGTGLSLFFLGKLAITFAFNSVYVFTAELFPTNTRSSALAACSLVGRIGSILAPQTPFLNLYVQALLYGACSLTAALAILAVPETRRALLPTSVEDAETMRSSQETIVDA